MSDIFITGLGKLPHKFQLVFDRVDFATDDDSNGHHEGRVKFRCEQATFGKDKLFFAGWRTKREGYHFEIKFDASVHLDLYRHGRIEFDFDPQARRWNMKAYVPGKTQRREWLFCAPQDALHRILSALDCFNLREPNSEFVKALGLIGNSLKNQANTITEHTARYEKAADCDAKPDRVGSIYETCIWCPPPGIAD